MPEEKLVITWRDGLVATYDDVTHSTPPGWLIVYRDSVVLWKFPANSIRAVGREPWQADEPGETPLVQNSPGPASSETR